MDRGIGIERQYVALDIETDGGQYDDGPNLHRDNIVSIAIFCDTFPQQFWFRDVRKRPAKEVQELLTDLFTNQNITIIGHNLQFDLSFIKEKWGIDYPPGDRLWDTMLAEQLLTAGRDEFQVNLGDTVERHFGVILDKSLQTSFTMDSEITQEQIDYIRGDVEWLPQLAISQAKKLSEHGMNQVWEVERYALPVFTEMVRVGMMIDLDRLNPLLDAARAKHTALRDLLQAELTPLLEWPRMEAERAMEEALAHWMHERDEFNKESETSWLWWMSAFEHGADPLSEWQENQPWMDTKTNKKDGKPEGMRRYVKAKEKEWRENNPRPPKPKRDTDLINLNSGPQMIEAFSRIGLTLPNFQADTLTRLLPDATPEQEYLLTSLVEYKAVQKLLSAFGDRLIALVGSDQRVRGNFRQIGTGTGRPTCTDPNMLQMPKDKKFRSCFIASPGYVLIVADYSQMELRIMAQLSKDKTMMESFRRGLDLHSYTGSLMFNKPIEECGSGTKERTVAKTINFGTLYQMGPGKLRETLAVEAIEMTFSEAKAAINRWKSTYKGAAKMIQQLGFEACTLGYTSTPFGRKRFFNTDFRDSEGNEDTGQKFAVMREGANHPIQGTNADITKLAMHMIQEIVSPHGGRVLLNIYDETVTEVPEHLGTWAESVVQLCMRTAAETVLTDVPAVVESIISRSWSELDVVA